MDKEQRAKRNSARQEILDEANSWCLINNPQASRMYMKNIQRAVCVVRRNRLVPQELLVEAGFNGRKR